MNTAPTTPTPPQGLTDERLLELAEKELCIDDTQDAHEQRYPLMVLTDERLATTTAADHAAHAQPVSGWQPISTAPQDGTEILASDYDAIEIVSWDAWETGSGWIDRNGQRLFPAWWQPLPDHPPIPQPPQGGEVEQ